jgi:hypothetical protein
MRYFCSCSLVALFLPYRTVSLTLTPLLTPSSTRPLPFASSLSTPTLSQAQEKERAGNAAEPAHHVQNTRISHNFAEVVLSYLCAEKLHVVQDRGSKVR